MTGIVWPDLPPWPALTTAKKTNKPSTRAANPNAAASGVANGTSVEKMGDGSPRTATLANNGNAAVGTISASITTGVDAGASKVTPSATTAASGVELPEEFLQLKAGPSPDDLAALEASSLEGTNGQRFLQMREVGPDVENGEWEGTEAVARAGGTPLRRPVLGEYVGECRPNGRLVATMIKAHGRRKRLDDACRVVLRMVDWGLKPDVAIFNSLASAAVWNGRIDLALEVRFADG